MSWWCEYVLSFIGGALFVEFMWQQSAQGGGEKGREAGRRGSALL
jgi:hypothetical protein